MGFPRARIEIFKATDGWRYRAKAGNSRIIGTSEEGHKSKKYQAIKAMKLYPDLPIFIILPGSEELFPIEVGVRGLN